MVDINDTEINNMSFNIPPEVLDDIQKNIEEIITSFPIEDSSKLDVIKKINFMYSHTRHLSVTDPLTGLYNRRNLDTHLEREFLRAKRYKNDLSIAVIDIDFFKKVNDTYGHLCGDYILKEVAYLVLESFRKTDLVFRYGGEEFVALLTETSLEHALIPLERLRKSVEDYSFSYNNEDIKITISIGVSANLELATASDFLDSADKALYYAKEHGRNQIITASSEV